MAQFDVHRNRNGARTGIPYLLIIQSRRFDSSGRRVVAPLLDANAVRVVEPALTPVLIVEDRKVVLHPLQIVSVPTEHLGLLVGSLALEGGRIIAALDLLISRAWG